MFKHTLLLTAVALTLTACGPEAGIQSSIGSSNSNPSGNSTEQTDSSADDASNSNSQNNTDSSSNNENEPDNSESDNSESDNSESDNSESDNSESDNSESDNSESDNSESDNSESDNSESDNSGNDPSTAQVFVNGNTYKQGDLVEHNEAFYECQVAGWCSVGASAYVPGEGYAWTNAWTVIVSKDDSADNGNTDNTDNESGEETDSGSEGSNGSDDNSDSESNNDSDTSNGNNEDPAEENEEETESSNSEDYTTELNMDGWPKPLKEQNKAYQNTTDKVVATYFVEWGVYGRDYHVADIPAQNLTHILYGFIPICGPNDSLKAAGSAYDALQQSCADKQDYEVTIHDQYAALEKSYPEDTWDQSVRGNFGQLMRMKASNPGLKVLPSVGGWTLIDPFFYMADDAKRATFVASVKEFLLTWDLFDGVDIDWEFPGGGGASASLGQPSDAQTYVILMRDLRAMLDEVEQETGREMELSSAIGASPRFINAVDYANAAPYMDYIFIMNYDFKGAWSSELGHQTNLYSSFMTEDSSLSVEVSINNLLQQNVDPLKLVVGIAKYGRGWANVSDVTGNNPFEGTGGGALNESGYWEAGIMDYKLIEERYLGGNPEGSGVNGWSHLWDDVAQASYLWNAGEKKLISFDSVKSTKAKSAFVINQNLGGVFSWETDADNGNILNAMHEGLGHLAAE